MVDDTFQVFLRQLAWHVPALLVLIGGLLFALVKVASNPLPCILALFGCGLMLLGRLCIIMLQYTAIRGVENPNREAMYQWFSIGNTALNAIGLAMLVVAVFVGRNSPTSGVNERNF